MAIVAHLVERSANDGDNDVRDGIRAVIIGIDDAVDTTSALILARAVTVCLAEGFDLPVGYFDTNRAVATVWDAAADITVFKSSVLAETIA